MSALLQVQHLTKSYLTKDAPFLAVNDVSFTANKGEIVGILGPNGSGKTTTLKSITGLTSFEKGVITINGMDSKANHDQLMFEVGAVLEGARNVYWRLGVEENIAYFAGLKGLSRTQAKIQAEHIITTLGLDQYRTEEVRKLSKGNQQKVAIACAVVHKPQLLLLDEPTLGLDVEVVRAMKGWLKELSHTNESCTLVTSHDMDFIEDVCDRVIIFYKGKLISTNSISELRKEYSPQKTITLSVEGKLSELTEQAVQSIAQWEIEEREQHTNLILRSPDLSLLSPSLSILENSQHSLADIKVSEDNLEDIFLNVINSKTHNGGDA